MAASAWMACRLMTLQGQIKRCCVSKLLHASVVGNSLADFCMQHILCQVICSLQRRKEVSIALMAYRLTVPLGRQRSTVPQSCCSLPLGRAHLLSSAHNICPVDDLQRYIAASKLALQAVRECHCYTVTKQIACLKALLLLSHYM